MDFEWNKIAGAVLGSILAVLIIHKLVVVVFHEPRLAEAAYPIDASAFEAGADGHDQAAEEEKPLGLLLAEADPARGERVFGLCKSCHTYERGGEIKQGPNLWGVIGSDIAGDDAFHNDKAYSPVFMELEGTWTPENLFEFLKSPRNYAPRTKMNFAGLRKPEDRAAMIAFLNQQTDNPVAFPEPEMPEPMHDDTAPGDGSSGPQDGGSDMQDDGAPAMPDDTPATDGGTDH